MKIQPNRCGCNCRNKTLYDYTGIGAPCCEHCPESPCQFIVQWGCNYTAPSAGTPIVPATATMVLRRECITAGCWWTSHWNGDNRGIGIDFELSGPPIGFDDGYIEGGDAICNVDELDRTSVFTWPWFGTGGQPVIPIYGCDNDDAFLGTPQCQWQKIVRLGGRAYSPLPPPLGTGSDLDNRIISWAMQITSSSTATLTGYPRPGSVFEDDLIVYECNDWHCPDKTLGVGENSNHFVLTSYPHPVFYNFPRAVCVVPEYTHYTTPCASLDDVCSCCDAGYPDARFFMTIQNCDGSGAGSITIDSGRNAELPASIDDPGGVCGYWWGTGSICCDDECTEGYTIGLLIWCDGSGYKVRVYCMAVDPPELVCEVDATLVECCPDFGILWTCSGIGGPCCCEPGIVVECCPDPFPNTLYATLSAATCATLDGLTITLTYVGVVAGRHQWEGTFTPSEPGTCSTPLKFIFNMIGGISCEASVAIRGSDNSLLWGDDADSGDFMGTINCPFVSVSTVTGQDVPTCMTSIMPPACFGILNATVSA